MLDRHAWNAVLLDGKWYNIDVTWLDSASDGVFRVTHSTDVPEDIRARIDGKIQELNDNYRAEKWNSY